MIRYKYDIKCEYCGKFINTKDYEAVVYTPFGTCYDLEPPEESFICGKCVEKHEIDRKSKEEWFKNSMWIPIQKLFKRKEGGNG